jgi:hypothetical protein
MTSTNHAKVSVCIFSTYKHKVNNVNSSSRATISSSSYDAPDTGTSSGVSITTSATTSIFTSTFTALFAGFLIETKVTTAFYCPLLRFSMMYDFASSFWKPFQRRNLLLEPLSYASF